MELSMVDDSMEVASDPHGFPGDEDIEIDLDIYQDHVGGDDNDVVVEDASATASNHPDMSEDFHEPLKDADMVDDDYPAGEVPDHRSVSIQDNPHENDENDFRNDHDIYSGAMEDDYEEDIDAPIPDNYEQEEDPIGTEPHSLLPTLPAEKADTQPRDDPSQRIQSPHAEPKPAPPAIGQEVLSDNYQQAPHNNVELQEPLGEEEEEERVTASDHLYDETNERFSEMQQPHTLAEEDETALVEPNQLSPQSANEAFADVEERPEGSREKATFEEGKGVNIQHEEEQHQATIKREDEPANAIQSEVQKGVETKSGDHEAYPPLHRVTVLYQEDEMSLFPPHESDPSELYLLEDEGLAHVPLRHLFQAFRGVLGNYVSENNELVIFIESLFIQLSELATQRSETTLSEIVQVYLDLSHNDGIENPEPLYINLDFKATLESEVNALRDSARQGKGLSSLSEWEGGDEEPHGDDQPELATEAEGKPRSRDVTPLEEERRTPEHAVEQYVSEETQLECDSTHVDEGEVARQGADPHAADAEPESLESKQISTPEDLNSEPGDIVGKETTTDALQEDVYQEQGTPWEGEENNSAAEIRNGLGYDVNEPHGQTATLPAEDDQLDLEEFEDGEVSTYANNHSVASLENEHNQTSPLASEVSTSGTPRAVSPTGALVNGEKIEVSLEEERSPFEAGLSADALDPEGSSIDPQETEAASYMFQTEDNQDLTYAQEQGQDRPATPDSSPDVFDIDADIFKSPLAEQREPMKPVTTNIRTLGGSNVFTVDTESKHAYHVSTLNTTEDELAEWDLVESGLSDLEDHLPARDSSPKTAKRPRVDDEVNDIQTSAPELKRHRSQ